MRRHSGRGAGGWWLGAPQTLTLPLFFHLRYRLCKVLSLGRLSGGVVSEGHGNIDGWRVNGGCESGGVQHLITNNPH